MSVVDFYFASLAIFFAFIGLLLLMLRLQQSQSEYVDNNGYLFLSLVVFTLSLSAIHFFISSHENELIKVSIERILSVVNNMFLVLSLPYLAGYNLIKKRLTFIPDKDRWTITVVMFFAFLLVVFSLLSDWKINNWEVGSQIVVFIETFTTCTILSVFGFCAAAEYNHYPLKKTFRIIVGIVISTMILTQILIATNQIATITYINNNRAYISFIGFISFICFGILLLMIVLRWFFDNSQKTSIAPQATVLENRKNIAFSNYTNETNEINASLKIGYENHLYFFELTLPKRNIFSYRFENHKMVNGFLFLLFYAYAKKNNLNHNKTIINGYNISMFNNTMIQAINTNLTESGHEKIMKEDLISKDSRGRFELNIRKESIIIIGIDEITKETDAFSLKSILSVLELNN